MSSYRYTLSQKNLVPDPQGNNNTYSLNIPLSINLEKHEIAVLSGVIPYSIPSITDSVTGFRVVWIDGQTADIFLPINTTMSASDMNLFLQQESEKRGWYLTDSASQTSRQYFLRISANAVYYSIQFDSLAIPNAAGAAGLVVGTPKAGYTSFAWTLPATPMNPKFRILENNKFNALVGMQPGDYPATFTPASDQSFLSKNPQLNPVNAISIRCNCVRSFSNLPSDELDVVPIMVKYGQPIELSRFNLSYVPCTNATISNITVEFQDLLGKPIKLLDTNLNITLKIREIMSYA